MVQFSHRSHLFTINLNVSHVVLEDSGDVHFRELVLAEHDQQAGLPAGAIADWGEQLRLCILVCRLFVVCFLFVSEELSGSSPMTSFLRMAAMVVYTRFRV